MHVPLTRRGSSRVNAVDDRRILEGVSVDVGLDDQGLRSSPSDAVVELTVDDKHHRLAALDARGSDLHLEGAPPQSPLHQGRCCRVLGSRRIQALAGEVDSAKEAACASS